MLAYAKVKCGVQPMFKRLLFAVLLIAALLAAVLLVRSVTLRSNQVPPEPCQPIALDGDAAAARLAKAIQCKTVSHDDVSRFDSAAFLELHRRIREGFPVLHARLQCEVVNGHSLLYTWPGTDTSLPGVLFIAHLDVVAADEDGGTWAYPPFSGDIDGGFVWGRGTVDDKGSLMAVMEAVEALATAGHAPKRTVYLAFGHDEEVGGTEGAGRIAALLKERGVRLEATFDEGLVITNGIVPGMTGPLALVGVAEKGYASLELSVAQEGGHSSQPPPQSAIEILAAALTRINRKPAPARYEGAMRAMFDCAAPEMSLPYRLLFANPWLFSSLIIHEMEKMPATNAGLRTTVTATMFNAGEKDNVLPALAKAVVNCRLLPGDTLKSVVARIRGAVADDRVSITTLPNAHEASPVSDAAAPAFAALAASIRQVWPEVAVAPALDIGATDSKHYAELAQNQYRFAPFWFNEWDLSIIHGVNERVAVQSYLEAVQFYAQLIRNVAGRSAA